MLRVAWHQLAWGYYIPTEQESYCNINHLITNTVLLIAAFVIHMTNIFVSLRICYMQSGLTTTIHVHFCDSIWSTRGQQHQTCCVAWYRAAAAGAASARPLGTVQQQQPGCYWSLGNSSMSSNSQATAGHWVYTFLLLRISYMQCVSWLAMCDLDESTASAAAVFFKGTTHNILAHTLLHLRISVH